MSLQSDLQDLFESMQDGSKSNDDFCKGIGDSISDYVEGLQFTAVSVAGTDSINQGTFTGAASGSLSITSSDISDILKECCTEMWDNRNDTKYDGNSALAQAFADALDNASSNISWDVDIKGSTTVPGSPPVVISPVEDSGIVTAVFDSTSILNSLSKVFTTMYKMTSGGDAYFAKQLALLIQSYFTGASCSVTGTGDGGLIGSIGTGIIS